MHAIDSFLIPISLLIALLVAYFFTPFFKREGETRFQNIDGLRGYLAFFVYLHHSSIWFFYLKSGSWDRPPSSLYTYLGTGSVIMFFMITAFLFFNKLLDAKGESIAWHRLYISRVLRIGPLYICCVLVVFFIAAYQTGFTLSDPIGKLIVNILHWLALGLLTLHDINGVKDSILIMAGVLWTLPYEWLFYFLLPLWAFSLRIKFPKKYWFIALFGVVLFIKYWNIFILLPFLFGGIAAVLCRKQCVLIFCKGKFASIIILLGLVMAVNFFSEPLSFIPELILFVVFLLVVGGNSLFGMLSARASCVLGEISYGVYLLHGICLYVTFNFFIGIDQMRDINWFNFSGIILALTPVLIVLSVLSYKFIEQPAILLTSNVSKKMVKLFN